MDKVECSAIRSLFFVAILSVVIFLSGCQTAKGFSSNFCSGLGAAAEGFGKDLSNLWGSLQAADRWMQDNLW
jgi:predicted small secreted protein